MDETQSPSREELDEANALFAGLLNRLESSWKSLPDKPEETPDTTLRALWFLAAGDPRSVTMAAAGELPALTARQEAELSHLIELRMQGTPLAYLTGRQEFMGLELKAGPGAMIPRKETEILARAALVCVDRTVHERGMIEVLDLCTGSGNLALFLAIRQPRCHVTGVDLTPRAVELARENAEFLGMAGSVDFLRGDLFQPFDLADHRRTFDVVVCNPPYIASGHVPQMPPEISKYEPPAAFDGGPFGLNIPRRLIKEAPAFLKPGSWLCFEVGLGQGKALLQLLQKDAAYQEVQTHTDASGEIRAFSARTAFRPT